jgi:hypothetical protein
MWSRQAMAGNGGARRAGRTGMGAPKGKFALRWIARGLAALGGVLGLLGTLGVAAEIDMLRREGALPPFTIPGAPLGYYQQLTLLGLLLTGLGFFLPALAAVLAFRWPGFAGALYLLFGLNVLASFWGLDVADPPSRPLPADGRPPMLLIIVPLLIGALLLAVQALESRRRRAAGAG